MNTGQVRITKRHTGRIYIGMTQEHFRALFDMLTDAELIHAAELPEERKVFAAIIDFQAKLAKEG